MNQPIVPVLAWFIAQSWIVRAQELIESVLRSNQQVFLQDPAFASLLKKEVSRRPDLCGPVAC